LQASFLLLYFGSLLFKTQQSVRREFYKKYFGSLVSEIFIPHKNREKRAKITELTYLSRRVVFAFFFQIRKTMKNNARNEFF
jgi:hypothetical protein